ncbi:MAG: hypothetical protein LBT79_01215 [Elusimicrobiota bacterium]|jgi:Flp pilus assembly pilin Flp|nr:hypothetical protein [Elusimicrobiota bacterium]
MKFIKCRKGQGMVEYILIVVIVVVLVFIGFKFFGGKVKDQFTNMGTQIGNADKNLGS